MVKWLVAVGMALSGLGLSGCGSDEPGDPSQKPADLSMEDFSGGFAQAFCGSLSDCCADAKIPFNSFTCLQDTSNDMLHQLWDKGDFGVYDPTAAGECLAALQGAFHCGDAAAADSIPACQHLFVGSHEDGQDCYEPVQCKSGYCDWPDAKTEHGKCKERPATSLGRGKLGDSCAIGCRNEGCLEAAAPLDANASGPAAVACLRVDDLVCVNNTCEAIVDEGEECVFDSQCKDEDYCDRSQHRCAPRLAAGESCFEDDDCVSAACVGFKCAVEVSVTACTMGKL